MKKVVSILLCMCALLGMLCGCESDPKNTETTSANSGNQSGMIMIPMPDFTCYDENGKAVKLSDFKGKPVILNFWASWCGPCKEEMPAFNEAYKKYKKDIHFLMLDLTDGMSETMSSGKEYVKGQKYKFPVYFDLDQAAATAYSVQSIPMTYFVYADGNMAARVVGKISSETLQQGIDLLLN